MTVHGRVHRTESNGIDRDMAWGKLLCKRHRQAVDGPLRRGISNFTGGTDESPDRGDIQDTSMLVSYHIGNHSMAGVVDGSYIDAQDAVEFIWRHVLKKPDERDACVVDECIDRMSGCGK